MSINFQELKELARGIDSDIQKLVKSWEKPNLLMSGYGAVVEDASPCLERFLGELKDIQDQLIEDQESRTKYITSTDEYISSVESFYHDMSEQCDDIESMLSDYGYKPMPDESHCLNEDGSEAETSILTSSQMDHSQSFCSDLNNQYETDSYCTPRIALNQPKSIATPVITSLASVKSMQMRRTDVLGHSQNY